MINLFNNFGTPLLGDNLTYPFSFLSITYLFFPDYVAMTLNRAAVIFLTIVALTRYFRYFMSFFSSSVCSILTFTAGPSFLWHSAHHHFQASLLLFAIILILQMRIKESDSLLNYLLLYIVFVLLTLSVSMNIVIIMIPFLLANQFFLEKMRFNRKMILSILLMVCAFIFSFTDVSMFFKHLALSSRTDVNYGDSVVDISLRELILKIGWQNPPNSFHLHYALYFSIHLLLMVIFGTIFLFSKNGYRLLAMNTTMLGILPLIGVLCLIIFKEFWWSIPLLKAMDITRFWWCSNVFLMIPVGIGLDVIKKEQWSFRYFFLLPLLLLSLIALKYSYFMKSFLLAYTKPLVVFLFIMLFYSIFKGVMRTRVLLYSPFTFVHILLGITLVWAHLPSVKRIAGLNNLDVCKTTHYYSPAYKSVFQPYDLLEKMEPYYRLATEAESVMGHDLKSNRHFIFGSNCQSTLSSKSLLNYLDSQGLINTLQCCSIGYHFKRPWSVEMLTSLGVRYIIQGGPSDHFKEKGWSLVATSRIIQNPYPGKPSIMHLYENPEKPSLIYLLENGKKRFLTTEVTFRGNGIFIHLPDMTREAVLKATFVDLPGWRARVDGVERQIYSSEDDPFIKVEVTSEDKLLYLKYEPYKMHHFISTILLSIVSGAILLFIIKVKYR